MPQSANEKPNPLISVAPLRAAALQRKEEQNWSWTEMAMLCGFQRTRSASTPATWGPQADISRLKRLIGVDRGAVQISYANAVRICRGLGLDPVDCGV